MSFCQDNVQLIKLNTKYNIVKLHFLFIYFISRKNVRRSLGGGRSRRRNLPPPNGLGHLLSNSKRFLSQGAWWGICFCIFGHNHC